MSVTIAATARPTAAERDSVSNSASNMVTSDAMIQVPRVSSGIAGGSPPGCAAGIRAAM